MDNLTHTLIGVAMARAGLDRRVPGATLTLALASNLPDLDIVSAAGGALAYLEHHRGLSHAFALAPVGAVVLAAVLARWPRSPRRFLPTLLLAVLGICVHIVADLWTSYGTRALLPFDSTWYSWDWIFIVDPALLVLLLIAAFGEGRLARRGFRGWAIVAVVAYIGLRAGAHSLAADQAKAVAGPNFDLVRVFPDPLRINKWRFLARSETEFASGYVPAIGDARSRVSFPRIAPDALVKRIAKESRVARIFLDFSAFPRLETRREGDETVILWRDLRFADRRANGFFCEVRTDAQGQILSERMGF